MTEDDLLGLCQICQSDYSEREVSGLWLCSDCSDDYPTETIEE